MKFLLKVMFSNILIPYKYPYIVMLLFINIYYDKKSKIHLSRIYGNISATCITSQSPICITTYITHQFISCSFLSCHIDYYAVLCDVNVSFTFLWGQQYGFDDNNCELCWWHLSKWFWWWDQLHVSHYWIKQRNLKTWSQYLEALRC